MRRQKLVLAEFQLRLVLLVAAAAGVAAGVQALMLDQAIGIVAKTLPNDASLLEAELPGLMARATLGTLALLFPLLYFLALAVSFRFCGPLVRLRRFLSAVESGEQVEPCSLRRGDRLQDLCAMLNLATLEQRAENGRRAAQRDAAGNLGERASEQAVA